MEEARLQRKISKNSKAREYVKDIKSSEFVKKLILEEVKAKRRGYDKKLCSIKKQAHLKKMGKVNIV